MTDQGVSHFVTGLHRLSSVHIQLSNTKIILMHDILLLSLLLLLLLLLFIIIIIIIILYLSAHVQRTKQALGIAPHEALFKNTHTHVHRKQELH